MSVKASNKAQVLLSRVVSSVIRAGLRALHWCVVSAARVEYNEACRVYEVCQESVLLAELHVQALRKARAEAQAEMQAAADSLREAERDNF